MRIASLLASATEIIFRLGLEDQLVAISHECDYPPAALSRPRVSRPRFDVTGLNSGAIDRVVRDAMASAGRVYLLDQETLRRVRPDLILTQAVCEVCAVPTSLAEEAAQVLAGQVQVVSLDAHTLADVLGSIGTVAQAAGVPQRAEPVVQELSTRIDAVRRRVAGAPRPRVLALEWLDPPFVPGHWVPEMIEIAGGRPLAGATGAPSREVDWESVTGLDPDVLLIMPCGFGLERSREEADRHAPRLEELAPTTVAAGRAYVVDGSAYFNRSGPRLIDGLDMLAALFHPGRGAASLEGRVQVWQPATQPDRTSRS